MLIKTILLVFGIGLLATLGLDYILGIKTWLGRLAALFFSIGATIGTMWYFAEYGENPEDSVACWLFDQNKSCREKIASGSPEPVIPAPRVKRRPEAPTPQAPRPRATQAPEPEYVSFNGWWPTGTPLPDAALRQSPDTLWNWSMRRVGACQPLRVFVDTYPNDPRAEQARVLLAKALAKTERKRRIVSERSAVQFVGGLSGPAAQGEAAVCEGLYQDNYSIGAAGGCSGIAAAHRLTRGPTEIRNVQANAVPNSCKCSRQWLTNKIECSVKVEKTCVFETNYLYNLERCA